MLSREALKGYHKGKIKADGLKQIDDVLAKFKELPKTLCAKKLAIGAGIGLVIGLILAKLFAPKKQTA